MSPLLRWIVTSCRVDGESVVPDDESSGLVSRADLEVGTLGDVVVQELEQVFGFLVLEANNVAREARVDIDSFLASYWAHTDNGVLNFIDGSQMKFGLKLGEGVRTSLSTGSRRTGPLCCLENSA